MGPRRLSAVALAVGVLVLAAGCGGSKSRSVTTTATPRSWAGAANAVCGGINARVRRLPRATSRAAVASDLRSIIPLSKMLNAKLAAIPRPQSERRAIEKLLATARAETRVAAAILPALRRNDVATVSRLAKKLGRLDTRLNAMARALRAETCAKNVQPSG